MRFFVNPGKAVVSLAASSVFLFLFIVSCQNAKTVPMVLYFVLCIIYLSLTCHYAVFLEIDENGIRNRFLFRTYNEIPWQEIKEVGIANMRVMKNAEKKKIGELYFYFSRETMSDKERFRMCLHWPPKNKRYMKYSVSRLKKLQRYRDEKPVLVWLTEEAYRDRFFRQ